MKTKKMLFTMLIVLLSLSIFAQSETYYFSKVVHGSVDEITEKVKTTLKKYEFGVITEIDMQEKLKEKLENIEFQPYNILGVCNPNFAYKSIQEEENIGLFLPCKVLIKQIDEQKVEVVMIDPTVFMNMFNNEELLKIASEVKSRFIKALDEL